MRIKADLFYCCRRSGPRGSGRWRDRGRMAPAGRCRPQPGNGRGHHTGLASASPPHPESNWPTGSADPARNGGFFRTKISGFFPEIEVAKLIIWFGWIDLNQRADYLLFLPSVFRILPHGKDETLPSSPTQLPWSSINPTKLQLLGPRLWLRRKLYPLHAASNLDLVQLFNMGGRGGGEAGSSPIHPQILILCSLIFPAVAPDFFPTPR